MNLHIKHFPFICTLQNLRPLKKKKKTDKQMRASKNYMYYNRITLAFIYFVRERN